MMISYPFRYTRICLIYHISDRFGRDTVPLAIIIKSDKTVLIKGRMDAFLGNVIIEFENNLKEVKRQEAESQLRKYTAILWNNKGFVDYLCIATDGLEFLIYRPRSAMIKGFTENNIKLETVDKFDIREEEIKVV